MTLARYINRVKILSSIQLKSTVPERDLNGQAEEYSVKRNSQKRLKKIGQAERVCELSVGRKKHKTQDKIIHFQQTLLKWKIALSAGLRVCWLHPQQKEEYYPPQKNVLGMTLNYICEAPVPEMWYTSSL